jgi:hypothetical protein
MKRCKDEPAEMADRLATDRAEGADVLVLAVPGRRGTANMLAEARERGRPGREDDPCATLTIGGCRWAKRSTNGARC